MKHLMSVEPAVIFGIVRSLAYIAVGATGAWLDAGMIEPILAMVASLIGVDAATTAATRARVTSPRTAERYIATIFTSRVGKFVADSVADLGLTENRYAKALEAVAPVVAEFADSQLTDETKDRIQRRVMLTLRSTGLLNRRSTSITTLAAIGLLGLVLVACAPTASTVIDVTFGDDALLTAQPGGLVFDPGAAPALEVVLTMAYDQADNLDDRCVETEESDGTLVATCHLGNLEAPDLVSIESDAVTALARYARADTSRPFVVTLN